METPDMKYTGRIIKELREKAGENQEQLAAALQVANRETVARWESGARDLKREHIIALAKHFKVSADYLLGLSEVASVEADVRAARKVTGLSEGAVKKLADDPQYTLDGDPYNASLSRLIQTDSFKLLQLCLGNLDNRTLAELYAKEAEPLLFEIARNEEYSLEIREKFLVGFALWFGFSAESLYRNSDFRKKFQGKSDNFAVAYASDSFVMDAERSIELWEFRLTKDFQRIIEEYKKSIKQNYPRYKTECNKEVTQFYRYDTPTEEPETEEEQRFGEYIRKLFEEEVEQDGKHQ